MRELGLGGYRFSIAWPRIFPTGSGRPNADGLDYYRRLVDELHSAGITPMSPCTTGICRRRCKTAVAGPIATPRAGSATTRRRSRPRSARSSALVHDQRALGRRIPRPLDGSARPRQRDFRLALLAAHTLLLAHGEGMAALRSEMGASGQAGIALNLAPCEPAGDTNADLEAADRYDGFMNRWFLDALYRGQYPEDMVRLYGDAMPEIAPGDMELISQPTDVLGVNYYFRSVVAYDPTATPLEARSIVPAGATFTAMGWEVYPPGLYDILKRVHDDYSPGQLLVTENGAALTMSS